MRYLFFPSADRRQDEIWNHTLEHWGENQAIKYIRGLHDAIAKAANNPQSWRKLEHKRLRNVFYIRYEKHFIFFRVLTEDTLGIISILHEQMDIPNRLKEDLKV